MQFSVSLALFLLAESALMDPGQTIEISRYFPKFKSIKAIICCLLNHSC